VSLLAVAPAIATLALDRSERRAMFRPTLDFRAPPGFWVYSLSACANGLLGSLVSGRSEVILLRADGFLAAAGIFTVITGLASQMTSILDSTLAPLTPIAAGLIAVDVKVALRTFTRALHITAVFGTVATCALLPAGILMIRMLYGSTYVGAVAPFAVLALVSSLQTALGPLTAFAFATRSVRQLLAINAFCLVVDALLAVVLIPLLGLWGAVVANAVAGALSLVLLTCVVSARLRISVIAMVRDLQLFVLGLSLGGVEAAICVLLRGRAEAAIPVVALAGLGTIWLLLRATPRLRLSAEDVSLVTQATGSSRLAKLSKLLDRAGIVRAADATNAA
jgi:O-antigen/teichoic acid export membrane protein